MKRIFTSVGYWARQYREHHNVILLIVALSIFIGYGISSMQQMPCIPSRFGEQDDCLCQTMRSYYVPLPFYTYYHRRIPPMDILQNPCQESYEISSLDTLPPDTTVCGHVCGEETPMCLAEVRRRALYEDARPVFKIGDEMRQTFFQSMSRYHMVVATCTKGVTRYYTPDSYNLLTFYQDMLYAQSDHTFVATFATVQVLGVVFFILLTYYMMHRLMRMFSKQETSPPTPPPPAPLSAKKLRKKKN